MSSSSQARPFDRYFLTAQTESIESYQEAIALTQQLIVNNILQEDKPYFGLNPSLLQESFRDFCPKNFTQQDYSQIEPELAEIIRHGAMVTHPACVAHLHCPPLIPAIAAELIIGSLNQSMDSWDQSPSATILEQQLTRWLCDLFGYSNSADGTFTSGGTQSNLMGLLLARDNYAKTHLKWHIQRQGLPPEAQQFRIFCSDVAHFTIRQGAAILGLGENAVIPIETDENFQLKPEILSAKLRTLQQDNLRPIAIVATAGTTDFGSIDPLPELAKIARDHGLWFHVDAAYGGALKLSQNHGHKLKGIELADSITVDFHKLFYQPISCGAFLLKNQANFGLIKLHADYLNPESNEAQGIPDLVTKSIQTTRRFDALKLWLSLKTLGVETFGEMIDSTIELAGAIALIIAEDAELELANIPTINAVVFRYQPSQGTATEIDRINEQIPKKLMLEGKGIIAQTQVKGRNYLKFTLLNPLTTLEDLQKLLIEIKSLGKTLQQI
ncbi:aspartate aminotransferase family protein [Cyanobacterium aponinum AL20118]|uniref:Aspartate aminotransferase family protein n=1 Tax=Cyanobacterium aponinum AL20115 TaxID=3090662 RepID=A0AAF0ZFA9_9CHRO|nr:aspartate aminotransferase family protein [Cyanobacterium aponinum]WPF89909.1 aspartate aminotransferase family protein [Cyanobacterium aponinum AL20115]